MKGDGALEVVRAPNLEKALLLLSDGRPWRLLAGGTHALDDLGARATHVLSLQSLRPELRFVFVDAHRFRAGALATLRDLATSAGVREKLPLLSSAARAQATLAIQHRATLCGTLVEGLGAVPAALYALDATFDVRSSLGSRPGQTVVTARRPGPSELLTHVHIAIPDGRARQVFAAAPEGVSVAGVLVKARRRPLAARLFAASEKARPLRLLRTEQAMALGRGGWANAITKDLDPLVPARRALAVTAAVAQHLSEALASMR